MEPIMYRILLVEDDRLNQLVALSTVRNLGAENPMGYDIDAVSDGADAVDACARRRFDIVFMDIQMPGMDGYQATALIRQNETTTGHHTPIIGLSARAMDGDREAAIAAGLDDYLTKPLRKEELRDILDRWTSVVPISDAVTAAVIGTV
jgi:CheY-like chemotaxis protein